jgi:hypothetical protein
MTSVRQSVEYWQGKQKYSEKTCPSATLSFTKPTWPEPSSKPSRRDGKPAINRPSYGRPRLKLSPSLIQSSRPLSTLRLGHCTYSLEHMTLRKAACLGWDWFHFVRRPLYCLLVPAPADRRSVRSSWCNENVQGKSKYSEEICLVLLYSPQIPLKSVRNGLQYEQLLSSVESYVD